MAVSSVIMSKSYIVKGPTLSQEILCVRRREGEGRDNSVPLMHFFDKKTKKEMKEEKKLYKSTHVPAEPHKIQNKGRKIS